jgi:predicted Zn-dependent protease
MRVRLTRWWIAKICLLLLAVVVGAYWVDHIWLRHHFRKALEAMEDRDFRAASLHLEPCLAAWPRDPSVRILAAQNARRQGDLEQAWQHLVVHEKQRGPQDEFRREYRLILVQKGDERQTEELFELCLRDPPPADSHLILEAIIEADVVRLFSAHLAGQDVMVDAGVEWRARAEKALELWRSQRHGKADQVQAYYWAGRIQMAIDKLQAAALFRKGLELDADHSEMRLMLAIALTDYDPKEASEHLEILRRHDPKNPHVAVGLASTLRGLGQLDKAGTILDEVLAAHPEHVRALLERGKTSLEAGQPSEAEPYLRRALTLAPNEPFVHLALSRCLQLTGKSEDAQYHEKRYGEIESERRQHKRAQDEEARAIWRKRLEQEGTPAGRGPSR